MMRSGARFSAGLTLKPGAVCAIRARLGIEVRLRRRLDVGPAAGTGAGVDGTHREEAAADHHDVEHQSRRSRFSGTSPGLHGDVAVMQVPLLAEPRVSLFPHTLGTRTRLQMPGAFRDVHMYSGFCAAEHG